MVKIQMRCDNRGLIKQQCDCETVPSGGLLNKFVLINKPKSQLTKSMVKSDRRHNHTTRHWQHSGSTIVPVDFYCQGLASCLRINHI